MPITSTQDAIATLRTTLNSEPNASSTYAPKMRSPLMRTQLNIEPNAKHLCTKDANYVDSVWRF